MFYDIRIRPRLTFANIKWNPNVILRMCLMTRKWSPSYIRQYQMKSECNPADMFDDSKMVPVLHQPIPNKKLRYCCEMFHALKSGPRLTLANTKWNLNVIRVMFLITRKWSPSYTRQYQIQFWGQSRDTFDGLKTGPRLTLANTKWNPKVIPEWSP